MKAVKRSQTLFARAARGDVAARAQLDRLLKKHRKTEADIPPIRPRGRPRLHDRGMIEGVCHKAANFAPDQVTQRTKENFYFYANMLSTLSSSVDNLKRWAWLLRPNQCGETRSRKCIMSQLGRVADEAARAIFADRLCELKPTTREAIKLLREWEENRTFFVFLAALKPWGLRDSIKLLRAWKADRQAVKIMRGQHDFAAEVRLDDKTLEDAARRACRGRV
jgi:hypothetical protein